MNRQLFVCNCAFGFVLVAVFAYGGWWPDKGGSWPLALAFSMAAGALLGLCTRFLQKDSWRKEK